MAIKCLVFDCDGVLLDSVAVKTRAFARLAEPYGDEARDRLVMYHTVHGGVSRYRKFAWFFEEIIGRPITEEESRKWGEKFAEYALDEVRRCDMIPGARKVLETWHDRLPMYVCSGAPKEELDLVLSERGLLHFFRGVYGSPPAKEILLQNIISSQAELLADETLMIGDSRTDLFAAEEAGSMFYGIGADMKGGAYPWSMNLEPLDAWIADHI